MSYIAPDSILAALIKILFWLLSVLFMYQPSMSTNKTDSAVLLNVTETSPNTL